MNTPTLTTERLILRKFSENDLDALFKIYSDEEVNTFLPWFPLKTLEETRAFYKSRYESVYARERAYNYAVCLKTDNYPIGYINVGTEDAYDFGYALRKELRRNGFITEAGGAVIERLKKDVIPYFTATHDINNPKSGEVMKRLNMIYQYSYEEQWQPKNYLVTFRMYQLNLDGNGSRVYKEYWNNSDVHFIEENV